MTARLSLFSFILLSVATVQAQEIRSFESITQVPHEFSAASVSARMVDALGFRYYWATHDLRDEDYSFRPDSAARSTRETIEHIYYLVYVVHSAHMGEVNQGVNPAGKTSEQLREETLQMLLEVRNFLVQENPDIEKLPIKTRQAEIPYWNLLNGPLADAIYHTGQLVSFRRMSGNPIREGVDVFMGIVRE